MFKKIYNISKNNISKFTSDPKYFIVVLVVMLFTLQHLSPIKEITLVTDIRTNPLLFPFLASSPLFQGILMVGIVFILSNAPFMDSNQPYIIIRSGRYKWVAGQILYIVIACVLYFAIIMLFSFVYLLPSGTLATDGWGKIVHTLMETDVLMQFNAQFGVHSNIVANLTPFQAFSLSFVLQCLSGVFIGVLMFCTSLLFKKSVGILVGNFVILFDLLIINNLPYKFYGISPVSLVRLEILDYLNVSVLPSVSYSITYMIVGIVLLSILSLMLIRNFPVQKI